MQLRIGMQKALGILVGLLLLQAAISEHHLFPGDAQVPLLAPNQSLPRRIAIIGAGAAGSSAAYYLRQYADEANLPIDVTIFERNHYIGGRSTTVYAYEDGKDGYIPVTRVPVELGASIFVSVNHILVDAVKAFNLSTDSSSRAAPDEDDGREVLGVWNGREFVVTQRLSGSRWQTWWSTVKLLWRYGISPYRTLKLAQSTVGEFLNLYDEPLFPWREGLSEAVAATGLLNVTTSSGRAFLRRNGIGDLFATEIVQASTRVNYASNLGLIHGLETLVCMSTDGAMSVEGGNWQIFANMVGASGAKLLLDTEVKVVKALEKGYHIRHTSKDASSDFDAVILAAPYHQSGIDFRPAPSHIPDDIDYVNLHVTLFSSPHKLSPAVFNLRPDEKVPEIVLTTLPADEQDSLESQRRGVGLPGFFSISTLRSAVNPHTQPPRKEYIYKIFSPEAINATFLYRVLGVPGEPGDDDVQSFGRPGNDNVPWIYRHLWQSYPYLPPRITFEPQLLQNGLWYTSGIESFISTMETSSLSGKNVAKLVIEGWINATKY